MIAAIIGICAAAALIAALILRNNYELRHPEKTFYDITSEKADAENTRIVMLSDLHGRCYGEENADLLQMMREENPDYIFLAGDIITSSQNPDLDSLEKTLKALGGIAPVFYSPGNHEKALKRQSEEFAALISQLKEGRVCYLENERLDLHGNITVTGLDIDSSFYKKINGRYYTPEDMSKDMPELDESRYNIVLAHTPRFFDTYAVSGADLFLAGHYHGAAIRIGKRIGVISPQFVPFPKYSKGMYKKKETCMIVSAGCGSHKINIRIGNKPEVVIINIHGHII